MPDVILFARMRLVPMLQVYNTVRVAHRTGCNNLKVLFLQKKLIFMAVHQH